MGSVLAWERGRSQGAEWGDSVDQAGAGRQCPRASVKGHSEVSSCPTWGRGSRRGGAEGQAAAPLTDFPLSFSCHWGVARLSGHHGPEGGSSSGEGRRVTRGVQGAEPAQGTSFLWGNQGPERAVSSG